MKVWLLHIGEELPTDGDVRPWRYTYLAEALVTQGHDVLRWSPTFRHTTKKQRYDRDVRVSLDAGYDIQFVHARGYRKNVSLPRLAMYRSLRRRFLTAASREQSPDLIVAAIPSLEWADAALRYGHQCGAQVVVDVRDLWPDVFINAFPKPLHKAARMGLQHYRRVAKRICCDADAIYGVSRTYLDWGLALAERGKSPLDRVVPLGFDAPPQPKGDAISQRNVLRRHGIDTSKTLCCFAGAFEQSYDLDTVVHAARRLQMSGEQRLQIVLCGDGSKRARLERLAKGLDNVVFTGWVDSQTLSLIRMASSIGLASYVAGATQSLPNKPFEYFASEMAVVSSLHGELADLLAQHECGQNYSPHDDASLAETLANLSAPTVHRRLAINGRALWERDYAAKPIYERFASSLGDFASLGSTTKYTQLMPSASNTNILKAA